MRSGLFSPAKSSSGSTADRDRWAFLSSLAVGLVFGGFAMFYSLSLYARLHSHLFHGHSVWFAPGDMWMSVDTGRYVWDGSLNNLYRVHTGFYSLPLSSIVMAPIGELITRFHLVENVVPVAKPSAWLLVGPYSVAFNIFLLDAVRRLAWDLGVRRRLWVVQLGAVVTVLLPSFEWSHFEDVLALTFTVHACLYAFRKDFVRAGLFLSVAVCFKQWAILLVPLLVLTAPRSTRWRTTAAACALPCLIVSFFLVVEFHDAARAFFGSDVTLNPSGHAGMLAIWFGEHSAGLGRITVVVAAILVGWFFRKAANRPVVFLAVVSVTLLLRPLTEPVSWSYYWSPALCLAGLTGVAAYREVRVRDWIWPSLTIAWTLPRPGTAPVSLWWTVEAGLLTLTYLQVARNTGMGWTGRRYLLGARPQETKGLLTSASRNTRTRQL